MALVTKPNTFTDGTTAVAAQVNSNFDTIFADYNGNITNANISASAAISDTKLAAISTAGKVNLTALVITSQATGDMIYASSSSVLARLAVGTATQILHGGTVPAYSALVSADMPVGTVVQTIVTNTGAVSNPAAVTIPYDDTIPTSTEGAAYATLDSTITPKSATSTLVIEARLSVGAAGGSQIQMAMYQDAGAAAINASAVLNAGNNQPHILTLTHSMTSGTTSATTFKFRLGTDSANVVTLNGVSAGRKYGGVGISTIKITEIVA